VVHTDLGLGYRTWSATADSAFLASYTNAAEKFTTLFPDKPYLAARTPHPSKFESHNQPVSTKAKFAHRALQRLQSKVPLILNALSPSSTEERLRTPRGLQHAISLLVDESQAACTLDDIKAADCPSHPWRSALHISNRGDAHTLATIPTDTYTTIDNRDFEIIFLRRLLLPVTQPASENFKCARCHKPSSETMKGCPKSIKTVDLFGNHAISCMKDEFRTSLWHDPVCGTVCTLARKVGLRAKLEQANILVHGPFGQRADVAFPKILPMGSLHSHQELIITDVRTTNPCDTRCCRKAAKVPGAANDYGTYLKNVKWQSKVEAQGDTFMALCIESGGRLSEQFLKLIAYFASLSGTTESERRAFTIYALQRIHVVSQRGVAQVIRAHEPIPDGPCLLPIRGLVQLGVLPCGPLVEVLPNQKIPGPTPVWRDKVQRALSSLSIQILLASIPVVNTPALASAAGAT